MYAHVFSMDMCSSCVLLRVVRFLIVWMASTCGVSCSICDVKSYVVFCAFSLFDVLLHTFECRCVVSSCQFEPLKGDDVLDLVMRWQTLDGY